MYKINKVTNNVNDTVRYQIQKQTSFLLVFKKFQTIKSYPYGLEEDRDFYTILDSLYYIKGDMNSTKYRETKTVELVFSSMDQVNSAILEIELAREAARKALDGLSDAEYYNKQTNTTDESAN